MRDQIVQSISHIGAKLNRSIAFIGFTSKTMMAALHIFGTRTRKGPADKIASSRG